MEPILKTLLILGCIFGIGFFVGYLQGKMNQMEGKSITFIFKKMWIKVRWFSPIGLVKRMYWKQRNIKYCRNCHKMTKHVVYIPKDKCSVCSFDPTVLQDY